MPAGISLGARTVGNWTNALNAYAREAGEEIRQIELLRRTEKGIAATMTKTGEQQLPVEVPIQVMIDGPYGGCSLDLGQYETALLFAGGSGITFALGMLDDIVGRCVRKGRHGGEKTRRIEVAWCIRSFGTFLLVSIFWLNVHHPSTSYRINRLVCASSHGYRHCGGLIRQLACAASCAHIDLCHLPL